MTKKMTRKEALENAIWMIEKNPEENDECWVLEKNTAKETIEVLKKMIAQIDKQATRPKAPSKTRLENEKLADDLVGEMVAVDKPVNTKWITEHVKFVTNSQKANAVVKIAIEKGDIIRFEDDKKKVWYKLAE